MCIIFAGLFFFFFLNFKVFFLLHKTMNDDASIYFSSMDSSVLVIFVCCFLCTLFFILKILSSTCFSQTTPPFHLPRVFWFASCSHFSKVIYGIWKIKQTGSTTGSWNLCGTCTTSCVVLYW